MLCGRLEQYVKQGKAFRLRVEPGNNDIQCTLCMCHNVDDDK